MNPFKLDLSFGILWENHIGGSAAVEIVGNLRIREKILDILCEHLHAHAAGSVCFSVAFDNGILEFSELHNRHTLHPVGILELVSAFLGQGNSTL